MELMTSLADDFLSMMPVMVSTFILAFVWLGFCRWLYWEDYQLWLKNVSRNKNDFSLPCSEKLGLLLDKLEIAKIGNKADRLFFAGLTAVAVIAMLIIMYKFTWLLTSHRLQ